MSLQLYIGHTGQALRIDTSRVSTLDALRAWVAQAASIPAARQVFLTVKGRSVRPQTLLTENELFVFDSGLLSSASNAVDKSRADLDLPEPLDAGAPPDTLATQTDLQSWQRLFQTRLELALDLREKCASSAKVSQRAFEEQTVIQRGLGVAVVSLQIHTRTAEQKQQSVEAWSDGVLKSQERHLEGWEDDLDFIARIPANPAFARFLASKASVKSGSTEASLQSFVDVTQITSAASAARKSMTDFAKRVTDIRDSLGRAGRDSDELLNAAEQLQTRSSMEASMEPTKLLEEIDIILKKVNSDTDHVHSLAHNAQSVAQSSKMALLHTRNYLPNLQEYATEMNEHVRRAVQQRNTIAESAMQYMQTLAKIESQLSRAFADIKALDIRAEDERAFDTLNLISRLPHAYGSLLVEAVRRREWVDKMKRDSSTLAEEMATYQEEEGRRRKKWLDSVDDVVNVEMVNNKAQGIEISLQAEGEQWPMVSRDEVQDYIKTLIRLGAPHEVVDDVTQAFRTLDQPTKKQIKHAKTFKNGSIHEAAFGSTSLMLRGDDEYKVLREAHNKLEEELRGQKSRVRKLEDLLHRQTSISRATTGDVFTPQIGMNPTSTPPLPHSRTSGDLPRPGPSRARRDSSNQAGEEKKLARRIVMLEADLIAAREQTAILQRENQTSKEAHELGQRQVEEANSTKKDIMENMEAQQREFALERRNLEHELNHARTKIEEIEDEFDRLLGSRDNERSGLDARTRAFESELERLKTENEEEVVHLRQQISEASERNNSLGDQLKSAQVAKEKAEKTVSDLEARHESDLQDHTRALSAAHQALAPYVETPDKYTSLVAALEGVARKSASHVKDLVEVDALAKSENQALVRQQEVHFEEIAKLRQKEAEVDEKMAQLRDRFASESAKASSLSAQLEEEKERLHTLRSKFADGESGADTLRQRLVEAEENAGRLASELAESKSHADSLDVELKRQQAKSSEVQSTADGAHDRLSQRSIRAKEVSQKLYAQNARLLRLLETLGFAVSHRDSQMVIERASKVGASTTLVDPANPFNRAVSLSSPPGTRKPSDTDDTTALASLYWADAPTSADEGATYEAFVNHISLFSTDAFSDAIAKRIRDFEYTARKWQKEAKNYKDKSHRIQSEAQAKIAVRDFKEGDLALFLPTKGKAVGAWAAFNINAPHHFLREREGMSLGRRDWLVARITKVEERVVDLSRSLQAADGRSIGSTSDNISFEENDNPFDLSDGLTWYLVHATEEKGGAPTTPGLGKSTVSASNVDARGSIRVKKGLRSDDASRTLNKSLDSRRSSSNSKVSIKGVAVPATVKENAAPTPGPDQVSSVMQDASPAPVQAPVATGLGISETSTTSPDKAPTVPSTDHNQHPITNEAAQTSAAASISTAEQPPRLRPTEQKMKTPTKSPSPLPPRSQSPSKSVRSLARHLEPRSRSQVSPVRTPTKSSTRTRLQPDGRPTAEGLWKRSRGRVGDGADEGAADDVEEERGRDDDGSRDVSTDNGGQGGGWRSLLSLDYELESPSR